MNRSWMPTVAGILDVVAGVPAALAAIALVVGAGLLGFAPGGRVPTEWIQGVLLVVAGLVLAGGALAILGGSFAIRRRSFGWSLAGSIAAAVCFPPLGIPAIVLTVLAEEALRGAAAGSREES